MVKSVEKWGKVIGGKSCEKWLNWEKVAKSGEQWLKVVEKWQKVAKSGEICEKWGKVIKSCEKWLNWEKVAKSGEQWLKVVKSWEKLGKVAKSR